MIKMIRFLSAVAAVAILAGTSQAADVDLSVPDTPSWTGGYIGVVGGYGWGDSDFEADVVDSADNTILYGTLDDSIDVEGFLLGGQLGYDFDFGNGFVLGVAGDMSWSDMDGDLCVEGGGCDGSPDDSYASAEIDWLATVRARAGFTTGSLLIYGTGGLAIADAESTVTFVDGGTDPKRSDSNTHYGWVLGAGAEFKITENMSFGAEYLHVDLGSEDYAFRGSGVALDTDILSEADLEIDIIRASFNFRF